MKVKIKMITPTTPTTLSIKPINQFFGLPNQPTIIPKRFQDKAPTFGTARELMDKINNVLVGKDGKIRIVSGFDNLPEHEKTIYFNEALRQKQALKK